MLTEVVPNVLKKSVAQAASPAPTLSRLLTEDEAAEVLGVTPQTLSVWRCTKRYPLAFIKAGRLVRYRQKDLEKFIESRCVRPRVVESR
jgi:excisionase family DNA binding protein